MLLPLLILITGCQHPAQYIWTKPGSTPEQLQRALGECEMKSMSLRPRPAPRPEPAPIVVVHNTPGTYDTSSLMNAVQANNYQQQQNAHARNELSRQRDYLRACMMSKGWTLQRKEP